MPQAPWPKRVTSFSLHYRPSCQLLNSNTAEWCSFQVLSPTLLDRWDQEKPSTSGRAAGSSFPSLVEERGAISGFSNFFQVDFLVGRGWATLSLNYEWIFCMGISEELPRPPCWLCSVGSQLPLTSQLEQSWTTQLLSAVNQALWPDQVRLHSPPCVGLWLSFFHGCRQTRLEDWQNLFEDQRQGNVHPSGFPGQSGLSTWVCRGSKFLGGNELHLPRSWAGFGESLPTSLS